MGRRLRSIVQQAPRINTTFMRGACHVLIKKMHLCSRWVWEELPRPCHRRPAAHGFYIFPRIPRKFKLGYWFVKPFQGKLHQTIYDSVSRGGKQQ